MQWSILENRHFLAFYESHLYDAFAETAMTVDLDNYRFLSIM